MAQNRRNTPCDCGSGKKTKHCCGLRRGPGPADLAKAFLAEQRRKAASRLLRVSRDDLDELFDQMVDLPAQDVSMQVRLPRLLSPELEALRAAIDDGDGDGDGDEGVEPLITSVLAELDDPQRRAELAAAVLSLADAGRVHPHVAAVAMIDLNCSQSALLRSSLLEALAVSVGAARTPGGLLVVSR
jgi:hypothetical protein